MAQFAWILPLHVTREVDVKATMNFFSNILAACSKWRCRQARFVEEIGHGCFVPAETHGNWRLDARGANDDCVSCDFGGCSDKRFALAGNLEMGQGFAV